MTFVTALALGILAFIAAPLLAHRLRRMRADERPFAAAHLVPPAQPRARRRAQLEDKALFGVRAVAVAALALLGASPLVRCSRLSLTRSSGASMAVVIVLDDSMSMRAAAGKASRFVRARDAAADLLSGVRDGDAVGVVLAGAPARVALAPTTDVAAVASVVSALPESDRATDLDGALHMAESLLGSLPQVDKRIVLLSDLADGQPDAPPLGDALSLPLWAPLEDLAHDARDCAVLSAEEGEGRVRVRLACGSSTPEGRTVEVRHAGQVLGRATCSKSDEVTVVPSSLPNDLTVHLLGGDAVASDDVAPVLVASSGSIGVVVEAADETAVTGGPPVVEQALTALRTELTTRPLPAVPEQAVDFTGIAGLVVDDPPGFTPEQRRALEGWLDGGGVLLLALGPRAAAAPLGATLEPVLHHATSWRETPRQTKGVATDAPADLLGEATRSLADLGATHRTQLQPDDVAKALVRWSDGAPLVSSATIGRGQAFVVTLPFALDASDLPLRPAFLSLLGAFASSAHEHAAPRRTDVGSAWVLPASAASATGPDGKPQDIVREGGRVTLSPALVGAYHVMVDGRDELRVAAPVAKETDMRPRRVTAHAAGSQIGATQAQVDISAHVAVALLALMLAELVLRLRARAQPA